MLGDFFVELCDFFVEFGELWVGFSHGVILVLGLLFFVVVVGFLVVAVVFEDFLSCLWVVALVGFPVVSAGSAVFVCFAVGCCSGVRVLGCVFVSFSAVCLGACCFTVSVFGDHVFHVVAVCACE